MFGLRNKMTDEEREYVAKNQLTKLKKKQKLYELEDSVRERQNKIKEIRSRPRKEAFKKIGIALKPMLKKMKENQERNTKSGSFFNPIEETTKKTKKGRKMEEKRTYGGFNGGPF